MEDDTIPIVVASASGDARRRQRARSMADVEPARIAVRTADEASDARKPEVPYESARRQVLAEFESTYIVSTLNLHDGNVSKAARAAGVSRAYFYRLLRRHGLRA